MKEAVQKLVRSLAGDDTIAITTKLTSDDYGKRIIFAVARAGKHIYNHSFPRGSFKPMDVAKAIVHTLKEENVTK